ncbi:uncharacterized protein METZ01_LOCUS315927, partial [marine metagenome]
VSRVTHLLVLLMLSSAISGCLWWGEDGVVEEVTGPFNFNQEIPF